MVAGIMSYTFLKSDVSNPEHVSTPILKHAYVKKLSSNNK